MIVLSFNRLQSYKAKFGYMGFVFGPRIEALMSSTLDKIKQQRCNFLFIFQEARRPYDVKDVIEQYTVGQMEMFGYIKKFQSRYE